MEYILLYLTQHKFGFDFDLLGLVWEWQQVLVLLVAVEIWEEIGFAWASPVTGLEHYLDAVGFAY